MLQLAQTEDSSLGTFGPTAYCCLLEYCFLVGCQAIFNSLRLRRSSRCYVIC